MLQLRVEFGNKGLARRSALQQAPYGGSAIAVFRARADRISRLEGEVGLDGMYRGEVVVLDFAELEEAVVNDSLGTSFEVLSLRDNDVGLEGSQTYFSQHFGAYSTSRSMVISPRDVSKRTDMA